MAAGPGEEIRRRAIRLELELRPTDTSSRLGSRLPRPLRESIYPTHQPRPLRRHDRRQSLGPDPRRAAAHGVLANQPRRDGPHRRCQAGLQRPTRQPDVQGRTSNLRSDPRSRRHRHVHILLDRKTLTTAYPQLTVSGGKGANIRLTYAEALYDNQQHKGDRDAISYKDANGASTPA